jgi:hypothetical protein
MKFCLVVPEICRGQVHGPRKERRKRKRKRNRRIIIIIIRNGAKTISIPNFVWVITFRLSNHKSHDMEETDFRMYING